MSEAYETPQLQRTSVETAAGHELSVLAQTLCGLVRHPGEPDDFLRARIWMTPEGIKHRAYIDNMTRMGRAVGEGLNRIIRSDIETPMSREDAAELDWWRTQFATRFPTGQLPKPGTALMGRRFQLSEGTPSPGPSFHVGVDLGGTDQAVLSLVEDGKVIAYARVNVEAEMHALGMAMRPYEALLHVIGEHARNLVKLFTREPVEPSPTRGASPPPGYAPCTRAPCRRYYKALQGSSICNRCAATDATGKLARFSESSFAVLERSYGPDWVPPSEPETVVAPGQCADCRETKGPEHWCPAWMKTCQDRLQVGENNYNELHTWVVGRMAELAALGYTPLQLATQGFCCAVGGVYAVTTQQPCPLHTPVPGPYTGDYDTLDFLKP